MPLTGSTGPAESVGRRRPGLARESEVAWLAILLAAMVCGGCSTVSIEKARANFYSGRFSHADENLSAIPPGDKDEILLLAERGMIRQSRGLYDESSRDWRDATEINDRMARYSASGQTASLLVNDSVLAYRGMPFERTLIYTFLAKNYLAQYNWDYAAICARNIIAHLEGLNGFPDIAYSRYMAAFCLEMINDRGNAWNQYRCAADLGRSNSLAISPDTGLIAFLSTNATGNGGSVYAIPPGQYPCELVCFVGIGKMPRWQQSEYDPAMAPYAEIYSGGNLLGRSYPLSNTGQLMYRSKERLAALQAGKDASRVVVKEIISQSVESQNAALGSVTRMILFSLEQPDSRCWETLPLWLEVARVPCPMGLKSYEVVFKSQGGGTLKSKTVTTPISRRGSVYISFCRDLEEEPLPPRGNAPAASNAPPAQAK